MTALYHERMPNTPGIYRITCAPTGKIYIGSAVNLRWRRKTHFRTLQRNEHRNPKLQNAWNKYGPDNFTFEVLELVLLPEMLTAREQYWFEKLKPFGSKGFNLDRVAGSSLGRVVSQASREKSRATQLGRPSTRIGWKPTPEQLERARISHRGNKQSEEHIRKRVAARRGQKRTPATREKQRLAALGHAPTKVRDYIVTSPDGIEYEVHNLAEFCREHELNATGMALAASGKRKQYKGWKAHYA